MTSTPDDLPTAPATPPPGSPPAADERPVDASTDPAAPASAKAGPGATTRGERAAEKSLADRIVWIDCEMTGLSLETDALIEVAALVTDFELNQLGDGVDVVIRPPDEALAQMGDFVRDMHTSSGLLDELARGLTMAQAQERVLAYVRQWVPDQGKAPLGGNTVATDRGFLARDMPELEAWLHYRIIDVSSIKELSRRWYPRAYFNSPTKHGGHRALADIRESIAELRYYREAVFVPQPGPDTERAKALGAKYEIRATD